MGGEAGDQFEATEAAITDERASVLLRQNRAIAIRHHWGDVGWDMPEADAAALTDEAVLGLNTQIQSGRYDVSNKNLRLVSEESRSCASPGEPETACEWGDAIFEREGRYYLRSYSFARWQPRSAQVDWSLILDRPSAAWVVGRLASGEKRDGRDDLYFPTAKRFLGDPDSVPSGTLSSIGRVETPVGPLVLVFERAFLFHEDGRVLLLDLDRDCPNGTTFSGVSCS